MAGKEPNFMKLVQDHEREWGTATYPGRPELADIIASNVVVFWYPVPKDKTQAKLVDTRTFITLHKDLSTVENHLAHMVLRSAVQFPDRKLAYVFKNQKRLKVKAVQITFEEAE